MFIEVVVEAIAEMALTAAARKNRTLRRIVLGTVALVVAIAIGIAIGQA